MAAMRPLGRRRRGEDQTADEGKRRHDEMEPAAQVRLDGIDEGIDLLADVVRDLLDLGAGGVHGSTVTYAPVGRPCPDGLRSAFVRGATARR
ncbi:hypothetical protein [Janibacter hoylei]|uniref:hypothetical protein n=1 Tax=Janibacter hoylei TaxID=364298 RepID=UPI00389AF68B